MGFKAILVAPTFPNAPAPLQGGKNLARQFGAKIVLLHSSNRGSWPGSEHLKAEPADLLPAVPGGGPTAPG